MILSHHSHQPPLCSLLTSRKSLPVPLCGFVLTTRLPNSIKASTEWAHLALLHLQS